MNKDNVSIEIAACNHFYTIIKAGVKKRKSKDEDDKEDVEKKGTVKYLVESYFAEVVQNYRSGKQSSDLIHYFFMDFMEMHRKKMDIVKTSKLTYDKMLDYLRKQKGHTFQCQKLLKCYENPVLLLEELYATCVEKLLDFCSYEILEKKENETEKEFQRRIEDWYGYIKEDILIRIQEKQKRYLHFIYSVALYEMMVYKYDELDTFHLKTEQLPEALQDVIQWQKEMDDNSSLEENALRVFESIYKAGNWQYHLISLYALMQTVICIEYINYKCQGVEKVNFSVIEDMRIKEKKYLVYGYMLTEKEKNLGKNVFRMTDKKRAGIYRKKMERIQEIFSGKNRVDDILELAKRYINLLEDREKNKVWIEKIERELVEPVFKDSIKKRRKSYTDFLTKI
ncbi:MAG: hypothetical protein J6A75_02295 [Lachnospiraceae bacterium]|nr:hypothetical protein [Lachnospiraceae bacterium]